MTASASRKITIILSWLILILAMLVFFVILPQLREIRKTTLLVAKNKQELLRLAQELQGYKALTAKLEEIQEEKEQLQKMFPRREEMVGLIQGLEAVATNSGVEYELKITDRQENPDLKQTSPPLVSGLTEIEEVPFVLELTGNYRQILDFLTSFDKQPFFSEFGSLAITAESVQNEFTESLVNTGKATAKIEGVFFISQ